MSADQAARRLRAPQAHMTHAPGRQRLSDDDLGRDDHRDHHRQKPDDLKSEHVTSTRMEQHLGVTAGRPPPQGHAVTSTELRPNASAELQSTTGTQAPAHERHGTSLPLQLGGQGTSIGTSSVRYLGADDQAEGSTQDKTEDTSCNPRLHGIEVATCPQATKQPKDIHISGKQALLPASSQALPRQMRVIRRESPTGAASPPG